MIKPVVGKKYRLGPFWSPGSNVEEWAEGICTTVKNDTYSSFEITKEVPCRLETIYNHIGDPVHNSNVQEL